MSTFLGDVPALAAIGISVVSVGIAVRGNRIAKKANSNAQTANELSAEANQISREANDFAKDTNSIAASETLRQRERTDIRFHGDWMGPGHYRLQNLGEDEAFDVRATVTVDDEELSVDVESVLGKSWIDFEFPSAARNLYIDRNNARREAHSQFPRPIIAWHVITEHAVWVTRLGTPGEHRNEKRLSSLE